MRIIHVDPKKKNTIDFVALLGSQKCKKKENDEKPDFDNSNNNIIIIKYTQTAANKIVT